jgi:cell division GTPase FtsZ
MRCTRRRFVGLCAAALAASWTPRPAASAEPRRWIIALGGAGARISTRLHERLPDAQHWLWNGEGEVRRVEAGADIAHLSVPCALLTPSARAEARERWADEQIAAIGPMRGRVAVLAGLGGRTGSLLLPPVMAALQRRGLVAGAFCTVPFAFEGYRRHGAAEEALQHLAALEVLPWAVRMDNVLQGARGLSLRQVIERADARLVRRTHRFLAAV